MKIRHGLSDFLAALALMAASLGAAPALAGPGDIRIENAWVRESPIGASSGGGYMRIINGGNEPDRLLGAECACSKDVVLKEMTFVGDTTQMRDATGGIEIPAGATVYLRLESFFVLFVGLKEPFKVNKGFDATLKFEKAGDVTVQFAIQPRMYWW